jgi:D-alanine-D-alanine ligase-like ATP-grasp enzyme
MVIDLFNRDALCNVRRVDVEPNYGYTTRLEYVDGSCRVTYGNDVGLNPGSSCNLAKDKGHTKSFLRSMDIECPEGREFLLPAWRAAIADTQFARGNTRLASSCEAIEYVQSDLGFPVYIKPVSGSKGSDIYLAVDADEVSAILIDYEAKRVRVAMIEKPVLLPDYRIVTLDDKLISAYQRVPLTVMGDGSANIGELMVKLQSKFEEDGRDTRLRLDDPRILRHLQQARKTLNHVPANGVKVTLLPISNLSAGGVSVDVTESIHPRWIELANTVARGFNLRFCGLDLACDDITSGKSDYSVLEVNAAPGLDHYASSGVIQEEVVRNLYTTALNAPSPLFS